MTCPNNECKQALEEKIKNHDLSVFNLHKTIYGPDGTSGLVGSVNEKVSKKALWGNIIALLAIVAMFVVAGLTAWGQAKDERKDNKAAILVIQTNVQNKFDTIESKINDIKMRQVDPDIIYELNRNVKKIIKDKETDKKE